MSIQLGKYFSSIRLKLEWGISEINLIISEYIFVLMAVFASVLQGTTNVIGFINNV